MFSDPSSDVEIVHLADAPSLAAQLVLSASGQILISLGGGSMLPTGLLVDLLSLADTRLDLRLLYTGRIRQTTAVHSALFGGTWQVRRHPSLLRTRLIVDQEMVLFNQNVDVGGMRVGHSFSSSPAVVRRFSADFLRLWDEAAPIELLFEDQKLADPVTKPKVLAVAASQWDELIQELARKPDLLHGLAPRKFEELVAELLTRDGLGVHLTPTTRDGGRDILAYLDTPLGRQLYFVECKRYSPERPVGVTLVRQLFGVVEAKRATAGVLITTSRFTNPAITFQDEVRYRISLRDYTALSAWLKQVGLTRKPSSRDSQSHR